jgi:hypothetical protein
MKLHSLLLMVLVAVLVSISPPSIASADHGQQATVAAQPDAMVSSLVAMHINFEQNLAQAQTSPALPAEETAATVARRNRTQVASWNMLSSAGPAARLRHYMTVDTSGNPAHRQRPPE